MNKIDWTKPIEYLSSSGDWLPARYVETYAHLKNTHHLLMVGYPDATKGEFPVALGYLTTAKNLRNTPSETKPSINPEHVAKSWKWLARDKDGRFFVYTHKPSLSDTQWRHMGGDVARVDGLLSSMECGTCKWENSLVEIHHE